MSISDITARDTIASLLVMVVLSFTFGAILESIIFGLLLWFLLFLIQYLSKTNDRGHIDEQ